MNVNLSHEHKGSYLLIVGEGERNTLAEIIEGTRKGEALVKKYKARFVLIDYRNVIFNVNLSDAFNLVKFYESEMPEAKKITIAAVVNQHDIELSNFWKSIGNRRNFTFEVFQDIKKAETWLLNKSRKVTI